jgi:hypothetical protein
MRLKRDSNSSQKSTSAIEMKRALATPMKLARANRVVPRGFVNCLLDTRAKRSAIGVKRYTSCAASLSNPTPREEKSPRSEIRASALKTDQIATRTTAPRMRYEYAKGVRKANRGLRLLGLFMG